MESRSQAARLEDHEASPDPASSSRQAAKERLLGGRKPARQVDHQELRAPSGQQGSGHPQSLGHVGRAKEEQPVEVHAPGDCLQGIEGATEVQVGGDRSASLRLGDEPQGEGRLPARFVPPEGDAGFAIQPSGAEDRVERGEAGRDHPFAERGEWMGDVRPRGRRREEDRRQGALGGDRCARCKAAAKADRGTSPAVLEMNKGLGQGFDRGHHGPSNDRTDVLYVKPGAGGKGSIRPPGLGDVRPTAVQAPCGTRPRPPSPPARVTRRGGTRKAPARTATTSYRGVPRSGRSALASPAGRRRRS
jgi:hypothetical protein